MDEPISSGTPAADSGTPAAAPAPVSIAETASAVIDQYDSAAEAARDTATAEPVVAEAPGQAEALTDEERLLQEFGYRKAFKPDGREHWIPRSKVLKMLGSGLKKGTEKWTGERTTLEGELTGLRDFRDRFATALQGDERAFIAEIARHDPRYARFLEQQRAEERAGKPAADPPPSSEPQPDIDLGNGQSTFSKAGLQKWVDWAVGQRLAPIEQREQQLAQQREQQAAQARELEAQEALRTTVRGQVAKAREWPQWAEYADDVLGKLRADSAEARKERRRPTMTLREAYLEVKSERLNGDANQARQRVIADLREAPRATSVRTGSEVPRTTQPRSIRDIAARNIERAERQGS